MLEEYEIFLEDCNDQLSLMESSLLNMQESGVDDDGIGAIFRAMHTIKGSAGMFGFNNIVSFTHVGENLLDEAREKRISVTESMIETLLEAKDFLEKLINASLYDEELEEDERLLGEKLIQTFERYLANETDDSDESSGVEPVSNENASEQQLWHISIRFKQDFFKTGMSVHSILNYFNKLGRLEKTLAITEHIPDLKTLDPLTPYIGFELLFEGNSTQDELEDIFEFVIDDVELFIFTCKDNEALQQMLAKRNEPFLQAKLIANAFYSETDFKEKATQADKQTEPIVQADVELPAPTKKKANSEKRTETKKSSTLRVDSNKIDILINYMSEIVIANSKLINLVKQENSSELEESALHMEALLEYVRDGIMNIRMIQVGDSFNKFRRIINDTAKTLGKEIEFEISGEETELDKTVVEKISDPLVHMLRNSCDHGIEMPQERVQKGKMPMGKIDLRAYTDSGTVVIEIEDDGKGLDKEKIYAKAVSNGLIKENAKLTDEQIYKLIFEAGLSTAAKVSDISGRGVGMDVVKKNIEMLRGSIDITSTLHLGSKITIRLPLTLAIIDGFLVQVGHSKYIIPLESIEECRELTTAEKEAMHGNEFINLRGEMLPILNVRKLLKEDESLSRRENIVIVHFGQKRVGLLVDELLGEHQTVIKSLGELFDNVPAISGGSILGSGEIALIFDVARLIEFKTDIVRHA